MYHRANPAECRAAEKAVQRLMETVVALGGAISGEHGIGLAKRDFMARAIDPATLATMHGIKHLFDPDGILNPGKVLPPHMDVQVPPPNGSAQ